MPNLYAHYRTAARSLERVAGANVAALIAEHRAAYNLGAQGPDIFFYYRAWPWTPGPRLVWLGNLMHKEKTAEFYRAGLSIIRAASGKSKEVLTAYLCGYAQHHALDVSAHPYVIYRTGDFTLPGAEGQKHSQMHRQFEIAIDACLLWREEGQRPPWLRSQKLFWVSSEDARVIGDFYAQVIPSVHERVVTSAQVQTAINDAQGISAALQDRGPSLDWLLVQTLTVLDRSGTAKSARYPHAAPPDCECLNLEHRPWFLPWDASQPQTASFLDLMEEAATVGSRMTTALATAVERGGDVGDLPLANRSFETGLDDDSVVTLRFFA